MENITVVPTAPAENTKEIDSKAESTGSDVAPIEEYLGTLQASSLEVWKLHLLTDDYNTHIVLNEYYEEIIELVDSLIEHWMGNHGRLKELTNGIVAENGDALDYLKKLRDFARSGAEKFVNESELKSDVDSILALLDSTIYKLRELISESHICGFGMVPSYADFIVESETFEYEKNENDAGYDFSFDANDSIYNYTVTFDEVPGTNDVQVRFNFNVDGKEYDTDGDDYAGLNISYVESVLETICSIIQEYISENSPERIMIHTEGNTMDKKYRAFINYATKVFSEDMIDYDAKTNTIYISTDVQ